jgi:hypothetical protein
LVEDVCDRFRHVLSGNTLYKLTDSGRGKEEKIRWTT